MLAFPGGLSSPIDGAWLCSRALGAPVLTSGGSGGVGHAIYGSSLLHPHRLKMYKKRD
jgi:hypothetical protein